MPNVHSRCRRNQWEVSERVTSPDGGSRPMNRPTDSAYQLGGERAKASVRQFGGHGLKRKSSFLNDGHAVFENTDILDLNLNVVVFAKGEIVIGNEGSACQ